MGLNFKIGKRSSEAQWSYSGFDEFRTKIAFLAGINLDEMLGFGGSKSWNTIKDDIVPFLNHSDCEGSLKPQECKKIYPRLLELLDKRSKDEQEYDTRGKFLVEDMKECVKKNIRLVFC